ncbi:MAG: hypothetical protein L6R42_007869, partial [Xanthoria sp. 1 TBL-2021]
VVPAPTSAIPKTERAKPLGKGESNAVFQDDRVDWDKGYHLKIGTSTRKITLHSGFALTKICGNLTAFIFNYDDVSYGARNSASSLTDEAVVRLAKACPKLKKVQLQGATSLTEEALTAFSRYCANLTSLEITKSRGTSSKFSGAALEALQLEPDRLPQLKKLILTKPSERNTRFMKAMRSLTRDRTELTIQLVNMYEYKKWGDWELEKMSYTYKKGRIQEGPI